MRLFILFTALSFGLLTACERGPSQEQIAAERAAEAASAAELAERLAADAAVEAQKRAACEAKYEAALAKWTETKGRFSGIDIKHPATYGQLVATLGKPDKEGPGVRNEHVAEWLMSPMQDREASVHTCMLYEAGYELAGPAVRSTFIVYDGSHISEYTEACDVSIRYSFPGTVNGLGLGGSLEATRQLLVARGARNSNDPPDYFVVGDSRYGYQISNEGFVGPYDPDKVGTIRSNDSNCLRF